MADEKKSTRKDGQVEDLPQKKISKDDAEQDVADYESRHEQADSAR